MTTREVRVKVNQIEIKVACPTLLTDNFYN